MTRPISDIHPLEFVSLKRSVNRSIQGDTPAGGLAAEGTHRRAVLSGGPEHLITPLPTCKEPPNQHEAMAQSQHPVADSP